MGHSIKYFLDGEGDSCCCNRREVAERRRKDIVTDFKHAYYAMKIRATKSAPASNPSSHQNLSFGATEHQAAALESLFFLWSLVF